MKRIRPIVNSTVLVYLYLDEHTVPSILKSQARKNIPHVVKVGSVKFGIEYANQRVVQKWWRAAAVVDRFGVTRLNALSSESLERARKNKTG